MRPHNADCLPAAFVAFDAIRPGNGKWILEDLHGIFKRDAMLAPVSTGLCFIPFEQDHTGRIITPYA